MTAKPPGAAMAFRVFFQDEVPAIGTGLRFVFARCGRKWAYLLCPYTLKACKIRLWKWKTLRPEPIEDEAAVARMTAFLRATVLRSDREATLFQRQVIGETT